MFGHSFVYTVDVAIFCIGFYGLISSVNVVKKLMALSIMQTALILLYICVGYRGPVAVAPVYHHGPVIYTNPLPQVLMLTAIVVGLAVTAVGLALCIRLKQSFGTRNSATIDSLCVHDRLYIADGVRSDVSLNAKLAVVDSDVGKSGKSASRGGGKPSLAKGR